MKAYSEFVSVASLELLVCIFRAIYHGANVRHFHLSKSMIYRE